MFSYRYFLLANNYLTPEKSYITSVSRNKNNLFLCFSLNFFRNIYKSFFSKNALKGCIDDIRKNRISNIGLIHQRTTTLLNNFLNKAKGFFGKYLSKGILYCFRNIYDMIVMNSMNN